MSPKGGKHWSLLTLGNTQSNNNNNKKKKKKKPWELCKRSIFPQNTNYV